MVGRMSRRVRSLRKGGRKIRRVSKRGGKRIKRRSVRRTRSLRKGSKKNGKMRSLRKVRTRTSHKIRGGAEQNSCKKIYELKVSDTEDSFVAEFGTEYTKLGTYRIIKITEGEYRIIVIVNDDDGQKKVMSYPIVITEEESMYKGNIPLLPDLMKPKGGVAIKKIETWGPDWHHASIITKFKTQLESKTKSNTPVKFNDTTNEVPRCATSRMPAVYMTVTPGQSPQSPADQLYAEIDEGLNPNVEERIRAEVQERIRAVTNLTKANHQNRLVEERRRMGKQTKNSTAPTTNKGRTHTSAISESDAQQYHNLNPTETN